MKRLCFLRGCAAAIVLAGAQSFAVAAPAAPTPAISPTGSLLQSLFMLALILGLIAAAAWAMKRFLPKNLTHNAAVKVVGGVSLGGRERILVVEVADQWIVVGTAPGRVSALATMARPPGQEGAAQMADPATPAAPNFAHWLKQTLDKRNGNNPQ